MSRACTALSPLSALAIGWSLAHYRVGGVAVWVAALAVVAVLVASCRRVAG